MTEPPDQDEKLHREIALFRFRIIGDLVQLPPGSPGIGAKLHAKAEEDYAIPGTHRTRVASETMRDWLQLYRRGGFDALYPKPRADRGQPRRLPPEVAELLVAIKSEHLTWSVRQVIQSARDSNQLPNGVHLPASTVHRLLTREGLMLKRTDEPLGVDRRRFTYQYAGELWMSDVMHGPTVGDGRQRHKSYLIAFIDDATRVIPYAAFARAENTVAFLPVLKQALIRRGIPHRLFVDNGANYRSQQLALVCAKLGIALIHARPYQPAGKGKIVMRTRGGLRRRIADRRAGVTTVARRVRAGGRRGEVKEGFLGRGRGGDGHPADSTRSGPDRTCRSRRAAGACSQTEASEAVSGRVRGCPGTTSLLGGAL